MYGPLISGYASLFNVEDGAGDRVVPGAFRKSLTGRSISRIAMLWQHDQSRPIGRWEQIYEDRRGLRVVGRLVMDTALGREAAALMKAGALSGLSIGFQARKARRPLNKSNRNTRLLTEIDLWEVSLVTFPQADGARARLLTSTV